MDNIVIKFEENHEINFDSVLVVLKTADEEFVFVKNKKRKWELTGGHIEKGEDLTTAAKREAWEESGAIINDIIYVGYYILPSGHVTAIVYSIVNYFEDIPSFSETEEIKLSKSILDISLRSFEDDLYENIIEKIY